MLEPPLPLLGMIAFKRNFLFFSNLFDLFKQNQVPRRVHGSTKMS
jgi:hypothetical protein